MSTCPMNATKALKREKDLSKHDVTFSDESISKEKCNRSERLFSPYLFEQDRGHRTRKTIQRMKMKRRFFSSSFRGI